MVAGAAVTRETTPGHVDAETAQTEGKLLYKAPGVQDKVFRKLRQGKFDFSAKLDLHGCTVQQAEDYLAEFIRKCTRHNQRYALIIHGKGLRSKQGRATIKSQIGTWLRQRQEVLAYCSAQPLHGGTGAIYVLLKRYKSNL